MGFLSIITVIKEEQHHTISSSSFLFPFYAVTGVMFGKQPLMAQWEKKSFLSSSALVIILMCRKN